MSLHNKAVIAILCAMLLFTGCSSREPSNDTGTPKPKVTPQYGAVEWRIESFDGDLVELRVAQSKTEYYVVGSCRPALGGFESLDVQMQPSSLNIGSSVRYSDGSEVKSRQGRVINVPVWRSDKSARSGRLLVNVGILIRPEADNGVAPVHYLLDKQITDVRNNILSFEGRVVFPERAGRYIVELHAYERPESTAEKSNGSQDLGVGEVLGTRIVEITKPN